MVDSKNVYQLEVEEVFPVLETNASGLTKEEAARRLEREGPNEIAFRQPKPSAQPR